MKVGWPAHLCVHLYLPLSFNESWPPAHVAWVGDSDGARAARVLPRGDNTIGGAREKRI